MSIDVDTREFQAAMKEAIRTSRRSAATVINGKHQDLLYKAGAATPFTSFQHMLNGNDPLKFDSAAVTAMATRRYGKGFKRSQRSAIWIYKNKRSIGKKFLMSGFILAGKKMRDVNAMRAGKTNPKPIGQVNRPIKAHAKAAGGMTRVLVSGAEIRWKSMRGGDAPSKERILISAIRRGMAVVTADTRRHMAEKLAKELAKLSAKGAR